MSDPIYIHIDPDLPLPSVVVERVLATVGDYVRMTLADMIESKQALLPYEDREFPGKRIEDVLGELDDQRSLRSGGLAFTSVFSPVFSPVSAEGMEITFWRREGNERVDVSISVREAVIYEREGHRERARMEWEWMKKLESHGLVSLEHGWSFEPPTDNEMPSKEYDRWWKRYHELDETPSIWPQNRECLLNIVENLKRVLSVKDVSFDPRLLENPPSS
jgi:hypothetical protein